MIYAARYGKTKLVTAKIIASLETITAMYVIFLLLNFILYMGIYGLQGWNVNIQSSLHYATSTYNLTFLQMFLISVVCNILGIVAMTIITLFISAKLNTPVTALITSCVVCFYQFYLTLLRAYRYSKNYKKFVRFYASYEWCICQNENICRYSTTYYHVTF